MTKSLRIISQFLDRYNNADQKCMNEIVTGDKTGLFLCRLRSMADTSKDHVRGVTLLISAQKLLKGCINLIQSLQRGKALLKQVKSSAKL